MRPPASRADYIVSPNAQANVEGNSYFLSEWLNHSGRLQQVFAASEFAPAIRPIQITGIAFRLDASGGTFTDTYPQFRLDLSTTNASPLHGMSLTFANNLEADDKTLYNGPLTISGTSTYSGGAPNSFDIVINFSSQFLYDPAAGNLLLDMRWSASAAGTIGAFDAATTVNGSLNSSAYFVAATTPIGDSDATSANVGGTGGIVTRFTVVPEPSSLALTGTWALILLTYGGLRAGRA